MRIEFVLMMVIFSSCYRAGGPIDNTEPMRLTEAEKMLDDKEVPGKILKLTSAPKTDSIQQQINGNLFGKFFCERAEFYIINNPQNSIYSKQPTSITLYYLDDQLQKTKYILKDDISNKLMAELGSFKIVGLNPENIAIIRNGDIIVRKKDVMQINDQLDNYELRWIVDKKMIRYRVNLTGDEPFIYSEMVTNYQKEFAAIEKQCI